MSTDTPWSTPQPSDPEDPASSPGSRPELRADIQACVITALLGVVLAFPVGAMWRWISPPVLGVYSQNTAYYAAPEGETFIARDGWFALFACIAAVLLAVFAFLRYRKQASAGAAAGLALGGFGASYLASWFGAYIGPGQGSISRVIAHLPNGTTFDLPLTIRATGVIWLWPAVAVGLFFFLMLLFGPTDPVRPTEFAGWGAGEQTPQVLPSQELSPQKLPPPGPDSMPPPAGPTEYGPSGPESSSAPV
jgi:hypothetical protein